MQKAAQQRVAREWVMGKYGIVGGADATLFVSFENVFIEYEKGADTPVFLRNSVIDDSAVEFKS